MSPNTSNLTIRMNLNGKWTNVGEVSKMIYWAKPKSTPESRKSTSIQISKKGTMQFWKKWETIPNKWFCSSTTLTHTAQWCTRVLSISQAKMKEFTPSTTSSLAKSWLSAAKWKRKIQFFRTPYARLRFWRDSESQSRIEQIEWWDDLLWNQKNIWNFSINYAIKNYQFKPYSPQDVHAAWHLGTILALLYSTSHPSHRFSLDSYPWENISSFLQLPCSSIHKCAW